MKTRGIDATFFLVKDMGRARAFYDGLLGMEPATAHAEFWAEYELPDGTTLALGNNPNADWQKGAGILLGVDNLDEAKELAKDLGGTATGVEFGGQTCKSAEVLDTEGNSLYFHERASIAEP